MNFDEAIAAHSAWKTKLAKYLKAPDRSLKADEIALDNRCDLGKWIHGEGARFANLSEYSALLTAHARFHVAAAEVVRKADGGRTMTEEVMLGAKTPYAAASSEVVQAIMNLKRKTPQ